MEYFTNIVWPEIAKIYPRSQIDKNNSTDEKIVLRTNLCDENDGEQFKMAISRITNTEWLYYYRNKNPQKIIYAQTWICQHNERRKKEDSKRNVKCTAKLSILIKKVNKNTWKNDSYLKLTPPLQAEVKLCLVHSHSILTAEALGMLRVNDEVRDIFFDYFASGMTPAESIRCHENKFLLEEDYESLANSSKNPQQRQVYHLHESWRELNLGSYFNPLQKLEEKLTLYESKGTIVKIEKTDPWAVIVVTPIMQRVQQLESAKEMIFIDSTCSCESTTSTLTVLLTASKVGALPIAVLIHPFQTKDNYTKAFKLLSENFPECFGGKTSPAIFMSDNSSAEKGALKSTWPNSAQLLCHFHVAQAEWRWLFSQTQIPKHEKPRLMKLFQQVIYAKSKENLAAAITAIQKEANYPQFYQRLKNSLKNMEEWVLLYRANLLTRQNNTNNYAEASIRILKDIVLCRTKAFNVVALTEFCLTVWEGYLQQKLLDFAYSRRKEKKLLYSQLVGRGLMISETDVTEVEPNIYTIKSAQDDLLYTINCDIGVCTCPAGISGAFCKHQCYLMETRNIYFCNSFPVTERDRYEIGRLALGTKCQDPSFFSEFSQPDTLPTINLSEPEITDSDKINYAPQCSTRSYATEEDKNSFQAQMERISNVVSSGDVEQETLLKVTETLKKIKSAEDLKKLFFLSKCFKSKRINVQPTSIARRRPGLVRCSRRVPSGRPPQKLNKMKGVKRKRNLSFNIRCNQANAKSHVNL